MISPLLKCEYDVDELQQTKNVQVTRKDIFYTKQKKSDKYCKCTPRLVLWKKNRKKTKYTYKHQYEGV